MIYISLIFLIFILVPKVLIFLALFQQNGYNPKKYYLNLKKHYLYTLSTYLEYISIIMLISYYVNYNWYLMVLEIFFILGSFMLSKQLVLAPVLTKRMLRLFITFCIICIIPYIFFNKHLLIFTIETVLIPIIILIASYVILPIEQYIKKYYYRKTKTKLNKYQMINIGITGSFGKTSTKNFLYDLLKEKYYTYKTPKSYNTPMGISRVVNDELPILSDVFIVEMGACNIGDINELVNLVNIDIGIITEIGPQHLETFKTIDNILRTKLEILNSKNLKTLIINQDNIYLKNTNYPSNIKVIRIGINEQADYMAKNIVMKDSFLSFDLYYQNRVITNIKTKLLGYHNIYNLLSAIAVAHIMGIDIESIKNSCFQIEPVLHRLSISIDGNIRIIDDAFNSNIVGFKNAVDVLKLADTSKIIITPGIVDGGTYLKELNIEAAKKLTELDFVLLVDNQSSKYIQEYFDDCAFTNYQVVKSFKQAYNIVQKESKSKCITLLIENDLPDNYLRR